MNKLRLILKAFGLIAFALIFYFAGYLIGHKNIVFEQNFKPKVTNLELGKPKDIDFGIFWDVWNKVTEKFVGDISASKMVNGAIKGMVNSLGDPYSVFMEPSDNKLFLEDLSGEIQGIGAELSTREGKLVIIAPLSDSPAEKAGLKANDEIVEIDGQDTAQFTLDEAIQKIRGKAGTQVKLLIHRADFKEPKEFTIKREVITVKSVKWEDKNGVGYIKISQFGEDTSRLTAQAASELAAKKAIILDLRNNPGGYLDASIDVASLFMERGVVVKEKYKDGRVEELKTTLEQQFLKNKIIVLINEGSASASEIVAGALRDSRHAIIIGKHSFGKGSVQEIEDLSGGTALRITVAKWLTPNGLTIDKEGIKPDIEIDLTDQDQEQNKDPQLDRALEEAGK